MEPNDSYNDYICKDAEPSSQLKSMENITCK